MTHEDNPIDDTITWEAARALVGDMLRPDGHDGETAMQQTIARSYTVNRARHRLKLNKGTIDQAIKDGVISTFIDPDSNQRIPAQTIESALNNSELFEKIAETERIKPREIADAMGVKTATARKRLRRGKVDPNKLIWGQIRGRFNLPDTLRGFHKLVADNREARRREQREKRETSRQRKREKKEIERRRRAELRARLVASFPAWSELDRSHQMMMLHIGPPNSGKTHDALNRLAEAGSGWYLAPLRLLAWEVFDRLNQRGAKCNLLTGEEFIAVEGAEITAATIEMFNPNQHGEVVIIDEAQMLADADRGWAWTRAMMSSLAAEMHVIAPETAQNLIQKMAEAANIPMGTVFHERLTPIKVAAKHWNLENIPPKTILVAFSRKMVLELKTRLEAMGRDVSVVYGSLPPEVRRKQAERFAAGETDVCVATDAVGMGLNLPADCVCFYDVEKFDGRDMRLLKPAEVQQIGGRAGRYGFSHAGEVGAIRREDLKLVKRLFYDTPKELTHARVAPTVDDLALIPGSLAEKLGEWSQLQSIPKDLRSSVKTADMAERIQLANMLSDYQVAELGLTNAVQLVNAPTRKSTREFWYDCAIAIIDRAPMPLPPAPSDEVLDTGDLDYAEMCIACADIYLWLSYRREFAEFAEHQKLIREERQDWSSRIDSALLSKIKTNYIRNFDSR
ncbi:MAG: helicase-related protein [Anaerolineae bacterium]|nr:helicase-related protein [Anaerolineae bacterium]MDQ7037397.1 helicase-related protein [Anaerolineae bacterium]